MAGKEGAPNSYGKVAKEHKQFMSSLRNEEAFFVTKKIMVRFLELGIGCRVMEEDVTKLFVVCFMLIVLSVHWDGSQFWGAGGGLGNMEIGSKGCLSNS